MNDRALVKEKADRLIELTSDFCKQHLNDEYRDLCEKLIKKMGRKRDVPFTRGGLEIWAASVIFALGSINFLFDRSSTPYVTRDKLCAHFDSKKSTVSQKAGAIRDMFKMTYWDEDFSTSAMRKSDPFANLVMVNGLIVPKDMLGLADDEAEDE
jgi:hypothetical protein